MIAIQKPLFPLGQVVSTPGVIETLAESNQSPFEFLVRHARGDWGEVDIEDGKLNDEAIAGGDRILSAYKTNKGTKIWIITESDRSSTCLLLPDEY